MGTQSHMGDDLEGDQGKDGWTKDCEALNLTIHQASRLANDRVKWRNTVCNKGSQSAGTSSSSQRL